MREFEHAIWYIAFLILICQNNLTPKPENLYYRKSMSKEIKSFVLRGYNNSLRLYNKRLYDEWKRLSVLWKVVHP